MQLGLAVAVALLIVGVVAWPLLAGRWRRSGETPEPPEISVDASSGNTALGNPTLEDVYEAIRILRMERSLGRIDEVDFREQLDEYRRQAAVIMRDLDRRSREE